jgi:hypothetical protein
MNTAIDKRDPAAIHRIARRVFREAKFVDEEVVGFAVEAHVKGVKYGKR